MAFWRIGRMCNKVNHGEVKILKLLKVNNMISVVRDWTQKKDSGFATQINFFWISILFLFTGLRLLPPAQSDALINEVKSVLDGSGFDNRGVEIMSELHEGLYGWVTVNYLMDQGFIPTSVCWDLHLELKSNFMLENKSPN